MPASKRILRAGGDAFFAWDFALLRLPPTETDTDGARILHEISHVLTFAGTDFYGELASSTLRGLEPTYGEPSETLTPGTREHAFATFAEAIPEALRSLGERTEHGTLPDREVARGLVDCVRKYRGWFDTPWIVAGLDHRKAWGPAAEVAGLNAKTLFDRYLLFTFAHTALDATVSGPRRNLLPGEIIAELQQLLTDAPKLPIPNRGDTVSEHVQGLLGLGERNMVTMLNDHFRLASVLTEGSDEILHRHLGMLPATIGLEFLVESWPEVNTASFFSNTADQPLRRSNYLWRRLRDDKGRARLGSSLERLHVAMNRPRYKGLPIIIPRSLAVDPVARSQHMVWSLYSFFAQLPSFMRELLDEPQLPMFGGTHITERLKWLADSSSQAVNVYLQTAASELQIPELCLRVDPTQLRKGEHLQLGSVWTISKEG